MPPPVPPPVRRVPGDALVHLRRARDHIDRHFAEELDLDELAAIALMSKFHFLRSFATVYRGLRGRLLRLRRRPVPHG